MDAIVVVIVLFLGLVVGLSLRGAVAGQGSAKRLESELKRLNESLTTGSNAVSDRLEGIDTRMIQVQAANQSIVRDIFDTLGDVRQATSTVAEQAKQFTALEDLLKPPKARGGVGEAMLAQLLSQVLPPQAYSLQHRFGSGRVVDAVVRMGGRLVCIDSKFPLSNHAAMCTATSEADRSAAERALAADVERHVKDIASRYIVEDEGTFDFAVMYVPAEGVFADILRLSHRGRPLHEFALEARVVPMSPLTMYGYLVTVAHGLRCLRIEERAQTILGYCARLETDISAFAGEYDTLGRHLSNAHTKYEEGARRLTRFRARLEQASDIDPGLDPDVDGTHELDPGLVVASDPPIKLAR